jgi:hypothetical protein
LETYEEGFSQIEFASSSRKLILDYPFNENFCVNVTFMFGFGSQFLKKCFTIWKSATPSYSNPLPLATNSTVESTRLCSFHNLTNIKKKLWW